jgi:hypothetical protein
MKTFTQQQLLDWIYEQPDDRRIEMSSGTFSGGCGCLLSEFLKDQGIKGFYSMSYTGILHTYSTPVEMIATVELDDQDVFELMVDRPMEPKNLGEVRQLLKPEYQRV